ncbi:MAG: tripartite tricarboxylate transporter substrate binding protein [Xanthobacteraceae bacterium]|nr:tripartite tricarboxylate transporter substrate binding protein [Xanthobacteraceae bacterium]
MIRQHRALARWHRRVVLGAGFAAAVCLASGGVANANYPERPIRIICGSGAGGIVDITARIVAERMSEALGQPVVVENMSTASSTVAIKTVSRSDPDGYTLLFTGAGISVVPVLYPALNIDVINDLTPISVVGDTPLVLFVHKSIPATNYQSLIAYLKGHPDKVNSGSNGRGTGSYLAMEFFKRFAGVEVVNVNYRSTPQVLTDLLTGRLGMTFTASGGGIVNRSEVWPVGITAISRSKAFAGVPTFKELGVDGFESGTPTMLFAPKGTPKNIVNALVKAVETSLADPAVVARLDGAGVVMPEATGSDFAEKFLRGEVVKWGNVLRDAKE